MKSLANADENSDLNLVLQVINGNNTIPVIVTSSKGEIITSRNLYIPAKYQKIPFHIYKKLRKNAAFR